MKTNFIIGIDLGTTNSAVAFVRRNEEVEVPDIELYEVPQLVAPAEGAPCRTLPSFLYIAGEYEIAAENLWLPWDEQSKYAVGAFAREQGALVPARLVGSAKSWLCYPEVDRRANILPWGSNLGQSACSPVEASALYLSHMRDAWNFEFAAENADNRFEAQEIVLTVPASFDQEARELTVEAARKAGLENLTLLEEPLAAFYSWIVANCRQFDKHVKDGDLILVCDVGGGTTDLSLIRVKAGAADLSFERTAVGEHLLLGGDNVDHALARAAAARLGGQSKLAIEQRASLLRQCCAAKERLLSDENKAEDCVSVRIAGSGSSFVGGALQTEITRDEALQLILEGFLPLGSINDLPHQERRSALRQIGLPFESDPAITRHVAAFLSRAGGEQGVVKPDAILFNGGFFKPRILRDRLSEAVSQWFGNSEESWSPKLLSNDALDTAVAVGAAYYGFARRYGGVRVGSGSPRAYYIGIAGDDGQSIDEARAVCVLPRGIQEGTKLQLDDRRFELQANKPVNFTLWSSTVRQGDALGDVISEKMDNLHQHSPLATVIRFGKRSAGANIPVKLTAEFTEVGTLELWCESKISEHRWRLQFQLRKSAPQVRSMRSPAAASAPASAMVEESAAAGSLELIASLFGGKDGCDFGPVELVSKLESAAGIGRDSWPIDLIRKMADRLFELSEGRKAGEKFEARWLNLYGFCLRPGFGDPLDEWRIKQARKVYHAGLCFPDDEQCKAEWMVLWRRAAGGFTKGQQIELYNRIAPLLLGGKGKRRTRLNPQVERETWRAAASLEFIPIEQKIELGNALIDRIKNGKAGENEFWSIGRIGARMPFFATIDAVLPPVVAASWVEKLLSADLPSNDYAASALAQLGARTGDPARDLDENVRKRIIEWLETNGSQANLIENLKRYVPPENRDAARIFGESLPQGLRLIG